MTIQIQVLSVTVETKPTAKGSYQQLEVAYKNLSFQGKVESKKIMSFGAGGESFKVLANAAPASVYEIETEKNDKGYIDWLKATKSAAGVGDMALKQATGGAQTAGGTIATRSTYETPEERAKKQIYIVRQSSLNVALATLQIGAKTPPKADEIIALAQQFESFVFDNSSANDRADVRDDISTLEDDIPF